MNTTGKNRQSGDPAIGLCFAAAQEALETLCRSYWRPLFWFVRRQGASPEEFTYWLPVFNQAIRTFQFADWWAEMTGNSWQQTLKGDFPDDQPGE